MFSFLRTSGGLAYQLSRLSAILNLAILESVGVALAYRRLASNMLQERARKRPSILSDLTELLQGGDFTLEEKAKREIAAAVDKDKRGQQSIRDVRNRQHNVKAPSNQPRLTQNTTNRSRSRTPARNQNEDRRFQANRTQNLQQSQRNLPLRYGANKRQQAPPVRRNQR